MSSSQRIMQCQRSNMRNQVGSGAGGGHWTWTHGLCCHPTEAAASDNGRLPCCPTPKVSKRKIDSSSLSPSPSPRLRSFPILRPHRPQIGGRILPGCAAVKEVPRCVTLVAYYLVLLLWTQRGGSHLTNDTKLLNQFAFQPSAPTSL